MGAYLNRPVVEKEREEGTGSGFTYACTTMQGWRANQEDAHNCVVDLHDGWHMFAVYDGHGGTEVSKFTSAKLPGFLKDRKFWEATQIEECLQNAFVDFDDFIRSEDSMKELKEIANIGKKKRDENDSEDEADRINTIEESSMPLAELIQRYGAGEGGRSLVMMMMMKEEEEEEGEGDEQGEGDIEKVKEEKEEEGENDKKKVQKRCSKSPILSEAKKSKSSEEADKKTEEAQGSTSDTVADGSADEEESDQEFVADEEQDDEEQSDEEIEETDLSNIVLGGCGAETPGEDSGTTACVCLVGKDKIVVANAGDSRAVLCRAGKAIDLSVDHKPEDTVEKDRIHAAGGAIEDGRVNGGLNLSRAFGDHAYKKNQGIALKDQMIT
uniref:protein-serine/threonine phosphatase n=1 Tax=Caenorhabditis japonica TaxID=281687 RepID=A0A8R1HZL9_CAEJA